MWMKAVLNGQVNTRARNIISVLRDVKKNSMEILRTIYKNDIVIFSNFFDLKFSLATFFYARKSRSDREKNNIFDAENIY